MYQTDMWVKYEALFRVDPIRLSGGFECFLSPAPAQPVHVSYIIAGVQRRYDPVVFVEALTGWY